MPTLTIEPSGCRSCSLCLDVCPTQVFDLSAQEMAVATRPEDCIGCTSCETICPSRCISVGEVLRQRPFYRIETNSSLVAKLLCREPQGSALSPSDWESALTDVAVRLQSLAGSVTETMGRGQKVVGRKAGQLSAAHLPEMYEGTSLEDVFVRLQGRFAGAFDFLYQVEQGGHLTIRFQHCALQRLTADSESTLGNHVLCTLFHEFWAGLISAFANRIFTVEEGETDSPCNLRLRARD